MYISLFNTKGKNEEINFRDTTCTRKFVGLASLKFSILHCLFKKSFKISASVSCYVKLSYYFLSLIHI